MGLQGGGGRGESIKEIKEGKKLVYDGLIKVQLLNKDWMKTHLCMQELTID